MEYWEQKYKDLVYYYDKRGYTIEDLNNQLRKAEEKLSSAEYKIEYELNPRIKQEERSYDAYVTSGGSDECWSNGQGGRCGFQCTCWGSKNECFEDITKEDLLYAYAEIEDQGIILDYIHDWGLQKEAQKIDIDIKLEQISNKKKELLKLKEDLKVIKYPNGNIFERIYNKLFKVEIIK